jgi:peroxiredoxin
MLALLLFANSVDPAALLAKMAETYSTVESIHIEAERVDEIMGGGMTAQDRRRLLLAARRADGRGRVEVEHGGFRLSEVSDGTRTYRMDSRKREWSLLEGAAPMEDSASRDLRAESRLMLLTRYIAIGRYLEQGQVGKESDCRAGSFQGQCVELTGTIQDIRHELLVEKDRGWVLWHRQLQKRSVEGRNIETRVVVKLRELRTDVDDALFAFSPEKKWRQVEHVLFPGEARSFLPGDKAADFTLASLDGGKVSLQSLKGRVVVLSFWATWCPPCRAEMPVLHKLNRQLGPDVQVLIIGNEDDGVQKRFLRKHSYELQALVDSKSEVHAKYGILAIPSVFVLDAKGVVRERFVGSRSEADLLKAIESARR